MSPIYKVLRENPDKPPFSRVLEPAEELPNGRHTIEYAGVRVPITVKNNDVTIHIRGSRGDIRAATVFWGMGETINLGLRGTLKDIRLTPRLDERFFWIEGEEENSPTLYLEKQKTPPMPEGGSSRERQS